MKKSQLATFGFVPILMMAALSACGGGGGSDVDRKLPTDDPTSAKEIHFWHCLGHDKSENLNRIVTSFNAKYTGKYKVVLDKIAGDYDSLFDAVKTKLAEGSVPALCMGYPDSFSTYLTKRLDNSAILRLDNFINDVNYGYTQAEISGEHGFVDDYYNEGKGYLYDGVWSMPMYKSTEVLYYNANYFAGMNPQTQKNLSDDTTYVDLCNALGNTATDEQLEELKEYVESKNEEGVAKVGFTYNVPVTWEDMVTVSRQMIADLKAADYKDTFFPLGYDSDANLMISQFAQRGIPYTVNDEESREDTDKHFVFNNAQAKAFTQELVDLVREKVLITKGTLGGSQYTNKYFTEGKLAMSVGSTGGSSYQVSANFTVKLAAVPYKNAQKYIMQGPSICFFNNDNDYIHKGAWLFYKELADVDNNVKLALENSYDPIRKDCYTTDAYINWIANAGHGVLKYDIPAITATLQQHYMISPCFVGSSEARNQIGQILKNVVNGGQTIDAAYTYAINKCKEAA